MESTPLPLHRSPSNPAHHEIHDPLVLDQTQAWTWGSSSDRITLVSLTRQSLKTNPDHHQSLLLLQFQHQHQLRFPIQQQDHKASLDRQACIRFLGKQLTVGTYKTSHRKPAKNALAGNQCCQMSVRFVQREDPSTHWMLPSLHRIIILLQVVLDQPQLHLRAILSCPIDDGKTEN